ncbi:hypothetical protein RHSIM_Rhsim05G0088300 [Rhododendron simsii]|uniref:Reticulon-like protein n=1 Tax=Rhododendron simsii TaxID=118357 RepID=A0A834GVH2_RHOSS|nr:hypothetical protein RHSIM_Rhsim05G0088300 [Rhododendron simsii]
MSSGRPPHAAGERETRMVPVPERRSLALPPRPPAAAVSNALVEYVPAVPNPEDEDLEVKLRRILENVPVRVSNTSGSSAGSGSGDFHQYRQMRRKEQDRLSRMDADHKRRKELAEFNMRREERMRAAEEWTAKKRLKRQKKKQKKKEKKSNLNTSEEDNKKNESSDDDGDSDHAKENCRPLPPLPDLEISEESVLKAADVARVWINHALSVAHDIAVGRKVKLFLQVASGLWVISYIGSFFNFLTLVYIGVLLSLSVPVLYEKYQAQVDEKLIVAHKIIQTQYKKLDDNILRKMPLNKEKKTQ